MSTDDWDEGTVYLSVIDKKGAVTYARHRAWHMKRFVQKERARQFKEGETVAVITPQEYRERSGRIP